MHSNLTHRLFFIFHLENILRSNLNFSTSYSRSTDLKSLLGLLLVSFTWLGEKISLKYLVRRGDVCPPHVQTVSTSLMSKLVKNPKFLGSRGYDFESKLRSWEKRQRIWTRSSPGPNKFAAATNTQVNTLIIFQNELRIQYCSN